MMIHPRNRIRMSRRSLLRAGGSVLTLTLAAGGAIGAAMAQDGEVEKFSFDWLVERARKAVRRRLNDALTRIESAHPALGRHLRNSVRTGTFCCYAPERDVRWTTESPPS